MKLSRVCVATIVFIVFALILIQKENVYEPEYDRYSKPIELFSIEDGIVDGNTVSYFYDLPVNIGANNLIGFYSHHHDVDVFIGDEKVYSIHPNPKSIIDSIGHEWNIIPLDTDFAGKEIKIVLTSVYYDSALEPIYFGTVPGIYRMIIMDCMFDYLLSAIILIISVLLMLYYLVGKKHELAVESLRYLSYTGFCYVIWFFGAQELNGIIFFRGMVWYILSVSALAVLPLPIIRYIRAEFMGNNCKAYDVVYWFVTVVAMLQVILQCAGITTFAQTLVLSHISIIIAVLLMIHSVMIYVRKNKRRKKKVILTVIAAVVVMLFALVYYLITGKTGSMPTLMVGIYMCYVLAVRNKEFSVQRKLAQEYMMYKKIAFIDGLSGLYNRIAMKNDFKEINEKITKGGIIVLDLNDLKKCNDLNGHNIGDEYIMGVANIISNVFKEVGRCYRYGGDEFCVVIDNGTEYVIDKLINEFNEEIDSLNEHKENIEVSVATGYALYNPDLDDNIEMTMNRADAKMYENKRAIKGRHAST